ncbi:MAG: uncharacterized protein QOE88_1951 [Verrucomicrobiota bacterium]|jgi:uncharacterized protein YcgI (DUF1989 family)|nr:uncharacterized protein [Verrucomicrobiota bacterium]MEA3164133.1 uncharacterized protein [Verrucomicrobiota bacterium]
MAEVIHIPARQAGSVHLSKGDRVSIIDIAGHQGADCFAITPDGTSTSSPQETRAHLGRLFPKIGQSIYSDAGVPFLTLMSDSSPGPHGLLVPPCDPTMYRLRGAGFAHGSCSDNLHQTLARSGIRLGHTPASICLFQNLTLLPTGEIQIGLNQSRAGDRVVFRAEADLMFVVSACPNDVFKRPPLQPTDLMLEIER